MTDLLAYVGEPSDYKWKIEEPQAISEMWVNNELYRFDPPVMAGPGDELFIVATDPVQLEVRHRYEARVSDD